jgi:hypothetical protein
LLQETKERKRDPFLQMTHETAFFSWHFLLQTKWSHLTNVLFSLRMCIISSILLRFLRHRLPFFSAQCSNSVCFSSFQAESF